MASNLGLTEKELIEARKKKLLEIKKLGINPYPAESFRDSEAGDILKNVEKLISSKDKVTIAGRIMALRGHGKLVFCDIVDESGKIQAVFKLDLLGDDFKLVPLLDLGDFIETKGIIFKTDAGEVTVQTESLRILGKAIRPLPDTHYGFKDPEARFRERYVDLLINPEVKEKFFVRSKIIQTLRDYLLDKGFLEVDTPVLQSIAGGATAKPFTTHYNAYERDVFLRIAPELYHKRLIVGGFEKIFEFARCFRNEGVDATHNPEFTNLEFYWAYADYEKMMDLVEDLIRKIIFAINKGDLNYKINDIEIDFSKKFARKTFAEVTKGENSDDAFKKGLADIVAPTFITNHPTGLIPLAKKNAENPEVVDTFQLVIGGLELTKAFSELNDPIDQRERFSEQMKKRQKGDEEAQTVDEDFLKALEYGMPPTSGCGIGIDRLVRVLTNSNTLREILFFPFMKTDETKPHN
jgi:lysyl-tRNA synthetase class 2